MGQQKEQRKRFNKKAKTFQPKKLAKPISLYPLKPEEALALFMQIDPQKIKS
jgi:hypothetical protein